MIYTKALKNTTQIKYIKYQSFWWCDPWYSYSNKTLNPIVTELFSRGRKLSISLVFFYQFYSVPKNIRLNSAHYFITQIPNKRELQYIPFNHSTDIGFQDFVNLYKKYTVKPFYFLIIDATLAWDNPLRFRKNLSERI